MCTLGEHFYFKHHISIAASRPARQTTHEEFSKFSILKNITYRDSGRIFVLAFADCEKELPECTLCEKIDHQGQD
ncbi:MAG: hypothetical protein OM95_05480 [Bdellovibrio sp. ArHS]|nr:MAG: hypothetical protein OM95_05480 [Bdellovibrio sp. ArHS]